MILHRQKTGYLSPFYASKKFFKVFCLMVVSIEVTLVRSITSTVQDFDKYAGFAFTGTEHINYASLCVIFPKFRH